LKKIFDKIASPTASYIDEREIKERAAISYFFQLHPNSCLCERRKKITSSIKLFFRNKYLVKKNSSQHLMKLW
jgi:hypothetical protein